MGTSFTGTIRSFYDGENTEGEGTIEIDGVSHTIEFGATPHGSEYKIDGKEAYLSPLEHEALDGYFSEIWPDSSLEAWEADVKSGVAGPPREIQQP